MFEQTNYIAHLVLGVGAAVAAVVALASAKGGRVHRWAGWVFAAGMAVAALTAWLFMIAAPLPLAMIQATFALYGLGTALLAINPHWRGARAGERALLGVLALVMAGIAAVSVRFALAGTPFFLAPAAFFAILAYFAVLDVRWLRRGSTVTRLDRVRRHALRMALVVSETVRAPTITFADDLGLPIPAIVFGSFLLVPLIYFAFTPQARRAAARAA